MNNFEIKDRIRDLIKIIYNKYSGVGGELHIVLDDKNIEDCDIQFCLDNSIPMIDNLLERKIYERCATLLLKLSYSARKRLLQEFTYDCEKEEYTFRKQNKQQRNIATVSDESTSIKSDEFLEYINNVFKKDK